MENQSVQSMNPSVNNPSQGQSNPPESQVNDQQLPTTLSDSAVSQNSNNTNTQTKALGWYYFVLAPISIVTALLSFLRSSDTFILPTPYLLFGVINLALVIFYFILSGKLRKTGGRKSKIMGFIMLPISFIILVLSYMYLYSLIFSLL